MFGMTWDGQTHSQGNYYIDVVLNKCVGGKLSKVTISMQERKNTDSYLKLEILCF